MTVSVSRSASAADFDAVYAAGVRSILAQVRADGSLADGFAPRWVPVSVSDDGVVMDVFDVVSGARIAALSVSRV